MRKEIRKFLEITSKEHIELDTLRTQHLEEIVKVYSDSLLSESTCHILTHRFESEVSDLLLELSILNRYYEGDKSVVELLWFIPDKNKETIRNSARNIQNLILLYVSYMAELGYFLSEEFIKKYGDVSIGALKFGEIAPKPNYLFPEPQQGQITPEGNEQAPDTTPEPQQDTIEAQQGQITPEGNNTTTEPPQVPTIKNTDRERWVYGIALEKGYIRENGDGVSYSITETINKSAIAYMCGRLYCFDKVIGGYISNIAHELPRGIKKLFGGTDIAQKRQSMIWKAKYNEKYTPHDDYKKIDDIFKEYHERSKQ